MGSVVGGVVLAVTVIHGQTYRIRKQDLHELDAVTLSDWEALEERALEPNAYLSQHFVIPAARHLSPGVHPFVILVEAIGDGDRRLVALGVFRTEKGTPRFPLRHLVAYRCRHTFLSGLLIDQADASNAVAAFFHGVSARQGGWYGVEFGRYRVDCRLHALCEAAALEMGGQWCAGSTSRRAVLTVREAGESYLERALSVQRRKDLRRRWRRLEEIGATSWRLINGGAIPVRSVEAFIELEHLGWKGSNGSSLRARGHDEAFFRDVVAGFGASGRVFFTELVVADKVVASTSNFVSGRSGFAFKIGWHPDYAKMAPGVLCEYELVRRAPELFPDLDCIDSGAEEGSYIEELWTGRRELAEGVYAVSPVGRRVATLTRMARSIKSKIVSMRLSLAVAVSGEDILMFFEMLQLPAPVA
jgi:CelD/BcsL family acetyltransferase involved in cellulose biosynthesis